MKTIALLLLVGCATTRTDERTTTPEPIWSGYMIIDYDSVTPRVAILFTEDAIISNETLASGVSLHATIVISGGYWRYPVIRGALLFRAVRVYSDGRVSVEMPLHGERGGATLLVEAGALDNPSGLATVWPCSDGACGRLHKAVANRILGCEGPGCEDLYR